MGALQDPRYRALIDRVVEARYASGQTQRDIATKLRRSPAFVAKFEIYERRLDVIEVMDVLRAIGVDPLEFLAEEGGPTVKRRRKPSAKG